MSKYVAVTHTNENGDAVVTVSVQPNLYPQAQVTVTKDGEEVLIDAPASRMTEMEAAIKLYGFGKRGGAR